MLEEELEKNAELDRWFKEKWVDISRKNKSGKYAPCGRSDSSKGKYPKCRPSKKVSKKTPVTTRQLTDKEEKSAIKKKREVERKSPSQSAGGKARKPKRAPTIKRSGLLASFYKVAMGESITSFDFDGTIAFGNSVNPIIETKIKEAKSNGKVYLVTSRAETKENVDYVIQFLKDNNLFHYFDGFYFVGGIKAPKLVSLGVTLHYDNDNVEAEEAKNSGIEVYKISNVNQTLYHFYKVTAF